MGRKRDVRLALFAWYYSHWRLWQWNEDWGTLLEVLVHFIQTLTGLGLGSVWGREPPIFNSKCGSVQRLHLSDSSLLFSSLFLSYSPPTTPVVPSSPTMASSTSLPSNCSSSSGVFSFSPANMVSAAVKQKSAFAPVVRPSSSPPPSCTSANGLQGNSPWQQPVSQKMLRGRTSPTDDASLVDDLKYCGGPCYVSTHSTWWS